MSGFDDGPLTGAPLSFPKSAQEGECCPPVLVTDFLRIAGGSETAKFNLQGEKLASVTNIEFKSTLNTTTLAQFVSAELTETEGALDVLSVTANTVGLGTDQFAVTVTGNCGCCASVLVNVGFD
jgi:hypothetical protein